MITRTALILVFLLSLSHFAYAQLFSYPETEISYQDCQSLGLFLDIDSVKTLFIHESYHRNYSVFYITYVNGSQSEKSHVPIEFFNELKRKLKDKETGPISLLSRPGKAFQVMTLKNRDIFGKKLTWEGFEVQVSNFDTTQYVKSDDIEKIYQVKQKTIKNSQYAPDDPSPYKLFLMPTGRAKKGFGFGLNDHMVILPGLNMSLPLNITLNGGLVPFNLLGYEDQKHYWFAPKISPINSEYFSVGFGSFTFVYSPAMDDLEDAPNMSYVVTTVGTKDFSFTYGIMFERLTTDHILQKVNMPADDIHYFYGAELRVSHGLKFIGEMLVTDEESKVGIVGIRLYSESASAEAGLILLQTEEGIEAASFPFACFNFYLK